MVLLPKTHGKGKQPLPSQWYWCQKHSVKARGHCLQHVLVPKTHGEGKRPLPSPCWCQQYTVKPLPSPKLTAKAGGPCLHQNSRRRQAALAFTKTHGEGKRPLPSPKLTAKASGPCLHQNSQRRQAALAFTKTHGEGKRPLPSPKLTAKACGPCLHHGFGAKNTR